MAKRKDQREFRVYVPDEVYRLLQSIAAIRDSSVNAVVNEAIEFWLADDNQHKTIEKHRLNDLDEP
jgi:predicted transcriptional regulator